MERRVLLAVFLCFVVLYAYQAIFVKTPTPRPRPASQQAEPSAAQAPPAVPTPANPTPETTETITAATKASPAPAQVIGDQTERTITVETSVVRAVFTNRGGELLSWRLKNYLDD